MVTPTYRTVVGAQGGKIHYATDPFRKALCRRLPPATGWYPTTAYENACNPRGICADCAMKLSPAYGVPREEGVPPPPLVARLRISYADDTAEDDSWNFLVVSDDDRVLPMVGRVELTGFEKWRALSSGDLAKLAPVFDPDRLAEIDVIDCPPILEED